MSRSGCASVILFASLLSMPVARARAYDTIRFLPPIPLLGQAWPVSLAVGSGRTYVLDRKKSRLGIYDSVSGQLIGMFGSKSGPERLDAPQGVAVGPDGRVYIADTGNDRIVILDAAGNFAGYFGRSGSRPGRLDSPAGVSVGYDGRVYVADTGNDRVDVFTADGILLFWLGSPGKNPGQMKSPEKVQVDPADDVYVLDSGNGRIDGFDARAKFLRSVPISGNDFAVDAYGFFYVLDSGRGKVTELDHRGEALGSFGSRGSGSGQFKNPQAVAIDASGKILVLDSGNRRIQDIELVNSLKIEPMAPNLKTKIFVRISTGTWNVSAGALAAAGDSLYAYLPSEGRFRALAGPASGLRFGTKGSGPKSTGKSLGFAASAKLGFYASDAGNDRVEHFDSSGSWKFNFGGSGGFFGFLNTSSEGHLNNPRGVAVNDAGTVYVADAGNHRIEAFSPDGTFVFTIGPRLTLIGSTQTYTLQSPVSIVWDKRGFVYFIDQGLGKIFKCEPSGALLAQWGSKGRSPGLFENPEALAFDGRGYLYALDSQLKRVSVYSTDGRWMTDLFSQGSGPGELSRPKDAAIWNGSLVISDPGKKKIVSFGIRPSLAAPIEISTAVKDGMAELSWPALPDPWLFGYRVYRADKARGPYQEVGHTGESRFEDVSVAPAERYFYRVAAESLTHDMGLMSPPVEVFVSGEFNRPPIEISSVSLEDVFPANYKWYLKNPLGQATVVNNVNSPFNDLKLTFRLKDFMDFGYDTEIKTLDRKSSVVIPLIATLNNKILDVTEDTPIQAEISLTYFARGKAREISRTLPLRVYSRNAIVWSDPRRIANFVTPNDPPVVDFARRAILGAPSDPRTDALNPNLVSALHIWDALSAAGLRFFAKPDDPYETISQNRNFPVDYTQFPRQTLKRKSGQCDDLTTLIASLLESAEIPSAILDYPGHMALMFSVETDSVAAAGMPEDSLVVYHGRYWVPVETTLLGQDFLQAVRKAAYDYKSLSAQGTARIIDLNRAWGEFEPATLPPTDFDLQPPDVGAVRKLFVPEIKEIFGSEYSFLKARLQAAIARDPRDDQSRIDIGILEFQAGRKDAAERAFKDELKQNPDDADAINDLGNIDFFSGNYRKAAARYEAAAAKDGTDPDFWMNDLKAQIHLKNAAQAQAAGQKAAALDADLAPAVETLLGGH
ncbi:MAG: hypothetical protein ACYCPQ_06960 [Elusimicrobiota bacterium]